LRLYKVYKRGSRTALDATAIKNTKDMIAVVQLRWKV